MPGFGSSPAYFRRCLFVTPPAPPTDIDLSSKCILITGATTGIGFACAKQLLERKASHLILPVRSLQRGEQAKERLLSETKATNPPVIDLYECDQASYQSVVSFVHKLTTELEKPLNVAILNAGLNTFKKTRTVDGSDTILQVNHLTTALLSLLLIPLLRRGSEPGRITIVASETHWWTPFEQRKANNLLDEIDNAPEKGYDAQDQYNVSKLLNVFWVRELAKRFPDIITNAVNPGFVKTEFGRDLPAAMKLILSLMLFILGRTPEVGARCSTYGAVIADASSNGAFLSDCQPFEVSPLVKSEEGQRLQEKVWLETVQRLETVAPEIAEIVK